ncbi:dihydrofolate reductase family protein [Brevibacterium sp. ZH18]|uniref:dihydrofolate reductase family protein n=1 Tax=Brevibacterium sp. ZH18 TaxID=2927784 RepID=UPI001F625854|nr:dihydrofolate reductase family protein [Brevibacterium sp. ZH18]MCI4010765.1 dihydrofolate reductase family protein [Brevibacterium sp. ZH18]
MPRTVYYTATSLDGFIADPSDSLAWLLRQPNEDPDDDFFAGVGAIVMGATTYEWLLRNLDGPWPYSIPTWVMTHRDLPMPSTKTASDQTEPSPNPSQDQSPKQDPGEQGLSELQEPDIRFAKGPISDHYFEMCQATGDHDLWVMGGGDLAGQFVDEGLLDEIITWTAPVTLGSGRPLLPRRLDLELLGMDRRGPFVTARHRVIGALQEDQ